MARSSVQNWFATELTSDVGSEALVFDVTTTGDLSAPAYIVIRPRDEANREVILCDVAFTDTRFETSALANRHLAGSAKSSGQTHPSGSEVWSVPLAQHLDDVWDLLETATSAATADALVQRDSAGRAKVVDGSAASDIATKGQLDNATTSEEGFRAYMSGTQSLSAATWTKIIYDTEERDDGGDYDPTTGEWTVPATGWYDVGALLNFSSLADGDFIALQFRLNGANHRRVGSLHTGAAGTPTIGGSLPLHLAAGDVLTVYARRDSAGDVGSTSGSILTTFSAKRRY